MLVRLVGQVVHRPPVAQVGMINHPQTLQSLEGSIDSGKMDVGIAGLNVGRQIVRGDMTGSVDQCADDAAPGAGDPAALTAKSAQDPVDSGLAHLRVPASKR